MAQTLENPQASETLEAPQPSQTLETLETPQPPQSSQPSRTPRPLRTLQNIRLNEGGTSCVVVDQTKLPNDVVMRELQTPEEFFDAIAQLMVRGAPCIGQTAAFAMACFARQAAHAQLDVQTARTQLLAQADYLQSSRPTAVNLAWALNQARTCCSQDFENTTQLADALTQQAIDLQESDDQTYETMARFGLSVLWPNATVLTHCNAGPLACGGVGSALGPAILGAREGVPIKVIADETRPLLQGARLTAFELQQAGVDVTLICDNMAASVMARGEVDAVMVGADRIAANGDIANKIGTLGVAVLAKHFGIPFYVLAPTSTIDLACETGANIPVEERASEEICTMWYERPMAPSGTACFNPAFDVTPADLVSGIITEQGIARLPFDSALANFVAAAQVYSC